MLCRKIDLNIKVGRKGLIISIFLLAVTACRSGSHEIKIVEPEYDVAFPLVNNIEPISFPTSIAVLDDRRFVLCTSEQVYLYESGIQKLKIGHKGKAKYEYVFPMIVRTYSDEIYIWCAMSLKFIVYDVSGNPKCEYPYRSAIADFRVTDDKILIYNAGRNDQNMIDVYDKSTSKVEFSAGTPSNEHRVLLQLHSAAPLYATDNRVFFTPKDRLTLYSLQTDGKMLSELAHYKSSSFSVEPKIDIADAREYLDKNSNTVTLLRTENDFILVTSEGEYITENGRRNKNNRFYSFYRMSESVCEYICSVTNASLGDPALFSTCGNKLFCLLHEVVADEDIYEIKAMNLDIADVF